MTIGRSLLGICLVGLGACATGPSGTASADASPPSLSGTRWVGVVDASTDRRAIPRLEFVREGRLTGFTGCNLLNGSWAIEGAEARLGPVATTKRMCIGPEGEMEKRVLAALVDRSRITREGDKLVLVSPGGDRFEFVEAAPTGY
jgi:heat shock protein HslJ